MSEITNLPYTGGMPFSTATPFTYREGITNLELIHALKMWAIEVVPDLNRVLGEFWVKYLEDHQAILNDLIETKDQWQALFDQFMADVVAQLEGLNDQAVSNLVANRLSLTGEQLREHFALRTAYNPVNYEGTDTERLGLAIANAFTNSVPVEISEDLNVTGNIPNYWGVFPTGNGSITREGYTFEVTPRPSPLVHTNNIFVNSVTGNDSNDGLSPSYAFKSLWVAYTDVLRRLTAEQAAGAKWVVHIAGTISRGHKFEELPNFPHNLVFQGEPLVMGMPVTVIEMGANANRVGIWIEPGVDTVEVNNIVFKDFYGGASGYAVLMKRGGYVRINDCRAVNCETGFAGINGNDIIATRCETDANTGNGFLSQYNGSAMFQYCKAVGASNYGFYISRNSIAHIDYCHATNCNSGVVVDMAARANVLESHLKRNQIGVKVSGAAEWINASSKFYVGTVDANVVNYSHYGAGRETRMHSQTGRNEFLVGNAWSANSAYGEAKSHSGSTANSVIYVGSALGQIPEGFFDSRGKRLRVEVFGKSTSLSARANVSLFAMIDGSPSLVQTAVLETRTNTWDFKIEFYMWAVDMTSQKTGYQMSVYDGSRARFENRAIDFGQGAAQLRLYAQLGDAADELTFYSMETFLMG